jgi:hypothetical protein
MIERVVRETTGTAAARQYAGTMAGFWSGLSGTLRALDSIAADPDRLDEGAVAPLRTLQYRLHRSSELLEGVEPPAGARESHDELLRSLVDARDATAEVVEAIELGGRDAAADLLYEWRGTLFRVHLARLQLAEKEQPAAGTASPLISAATASGLALFGAVAFVGGAALVQWPLWVAGLALVAGGLLAQRS